MAFNGTGTFERLYNWVNDRINGIKILASRMDAEMDGMATGLSQCITKDGQTTITQNIPMSSHKFTGLSVGNARTDSITLGQVQDNQFLDLGLLGGAADAYTATPAPAITDYVASQRFTGKIPTPNLTITPYLQISSIATPATTGIIKKLDNSGAEIAVEIGDLVGIHEFKRNVANDAFIVLNPQKPYLNSANFVNNNYGPNMVKNGQGLIASRGTSFTSTTFPANNDNTILFDEFYLLSDGNDIVDVSIETSVVPVGAYSAFKFDQETANKKWAHVQHFNAKDSAAIIGGTASLSFAARKGGSNATLETLRAALLSWDGTADAQTTDVISAWAAAGTNPTLVANWTYENTPSNLVLTTAYQTFSIPAVAMDTASTKNVALIIWLDDTDATVGDLAYISNIKIDKGSTVTQFVPRLENDERGIVSRAVWEFIEAKIASASNEIDIINLTQAYSEIEICLVDVLPATTATWLGVRYTTDNGATFLGANYVGGYGQIIESSGLVFNSGLTDRITITPDNSTSSNRTVSNSSNNAINGSIRLSNPSNSTQYKTIESLMRYDSNNGDFNSYSTFGRYEGSTAAINGLRFIFNSGAIASGMFIVNGRKRN